MLKPYVLVVDDESGVRDVLVRALSEIGYSALAVAKAGEAVSVIRRARPLAVITDMLMPEHDGFWLLEHIQAHWPSLPVIVTTGAVLTDVDLDRIYQLGAIEFMAKPFNRNTLAQALERADL